MVQAMLAFWAQEEKAYWRDLGALKLPEGKAAEEILAAFELLLQDTEQGLESDAVLLADINPDDRLCTHEAVYVGASRARQFLAVIASGPGT